MVELKWNLQFHFNSGQFHFAIPIPIPWLAIPIPIPIPELELKSIPIPIPELTPALQGVSNETITAYCRDSEIAASRVTYPLKLKRDSSATNYLRPEDAS